MGPVLVPLLLSWFGVAALAAPVAFGLMFVPVLNRWFGVAVRLLVLSGLVASVVDCWLELCC